jgi:hypothetical protein
MESIVLYSCTFSRDLKRAQRMAASIKRHNREKIPFYLSVPRGEVELFKSSLAGHDVEVFAEEEILASNPALDTARVYEMKGNLRQQVIKSEFWRLGRAENYLVLDADCVFIRDFGRKDFLADGDVPYSVVHEGRELLQAAARSGPKRVREEFLADRTAVMREMGREGVVYDHGYAPFLWSRRVWSDLAEQYLAPRGENFADLVERCPSEFTWYGEALMKYRSIPLWPRGELFRHYHYEHQYWLDRKLGVTEEMLARDYLGVVYQSNWETWTEAGAGSKSLVSRLARSIKRAAKKIAFDVRGR